MTISGEHQRTIPFYRDQAADDDEPIYSKPNKAAVRRSAGSGVVPLPREQFTVALGSDLDAASTSRRDRRCCCPRRRRRRCCDRRRRYKTDGDRRGRDRRRRRAGCCCCCCCRATIHLAT